MLNLNQLRVLAVVARRDDIVVVQALVAAGIGVATQPGLALQAHRRPDIHVELTGFPRQRFETVPIPVASFRRDRPAPILAPDT
jgi:DNA-binding transcriptional LysR family regulator